MSKIQRQAQIPDSLNHERLDRALATIWSDYSRAQLKSWITAGFVSIDHTVCKLPRQKVQAEQTIQLDATLADKTATKAQAIDLAIVHEDDSLIIVNKPVGLVVHPGAGNPDSTLQNALLHHDASLSALPRAGIVHRLDKDTSGLLVVARNLESHTHLVQALQNRQIKRHYLAIVQGVMISGGSIDAPIGRHSTARTKMAVTHQGKVALTHYRVKQRFKAHTLVAVELETGRTHQIRVHMNHIGYPIVGDRTYFQRKALEAKISPDLRNCIQQFNRQALHATQLSLPHPKSLDTMSFKSPPPQDFNTLLEALEQDQQASTHR